MTLIPSANNIPPLLLSGVWPMGRALRPLGPNSESLSGEPWGSFPFRDAAQCGEVPTRQTEEGSLVASKDEGLDTPHGSRQLLKGLPSLLPARDCRNWHWGQREKGSLSPGAPLGAVSELPVRAVGAGRGAEFRSEARSGTEGEK